MNNATPIEQVRDIMRKLRDPKGGCPWDREQNLESLKPFLIEECYELIDAIDSADPFKHKDELGDMLLQIIFQTQLREEKGEFTFEDICSNLSEKLIRRHPHVFSDVTVSSSRDVLTKWEEIKNKEKKDGKRSVVEGVPTHLPALMKAHQVQSRAARVGFDWTAIHDVIAKVEEELAETKAAIASGNRDAVAEEIGDLLFAVVNLSRFQKLHAEELLAATVRKFARRFKFVEQKVHAQGRQMTDCSLEELDTHWNEAKSQERAEKNSPL
jgi:tetrapyrrole methylase family protein/MazG family protein